MNDEPKTLLPGGATIVLIVGLALLFGRPFAELPGTLGGRELWIAMAGIFLCDILLNAIWLAVRQKRPMSPEWVDLLKLGWGPLVLVVVVVGPLVEELVFRYLLIGSLYDVSPTLAIGASGVLFGFVHTRGPLVKAVMGCMWAWLYIESGTLLVPLAMHVVWNAGALGLGFKEINERMPVWRRL